MVAAKVSRSDADKYLCCLNFFSNSRVWALVNKIRRFLFFPLRLSISSSSPLLPTVPMDEQVLVWRVSSFLLLKCECGALFRTKESNVFAKEIHNCPQLNSCPPNFFNSIFICNLRWFAIFVSYCPKCSSFTITEGRWNSTSFL